MLNDVDDRSITLLKDAAPSENDLEALAVTLLTLAKRTRALFGLELERAGFNNGQDQLLLALTPETALTVGALATNLEVRPSTVSKMLDRLHEKGLLERFMNPRDGRATLVRLTDAGILAQAEIRDIWSGVCRHIVPALADGAIVTEKQLNGVSSVLAARLLKLR
jgi:DNA-binding MarR family transcriptional regulator